MGESTAIAWTDHTFNPWWGCVKISPACDGCYAERDAHRYGFADGGGNGPELWGKGSERRRLSDKTLNRPLVWDRDAAAAGRPALVFCASMADVFEARDDLDADRTRLWDLIERTPNLRWQLLTKRPEQIRRRVPRRWLEEPGNLMCDRCGASASIPLGASCPDHDPRPTGWPPHAWVGTTVENQHYAELRIPRLLEVPAPVRFLSAEPLLGPIDHDLTGIDWVIVGGESGPNARPMHPDWVLDLEVECRRPFVRNPATLDDCEACGHEYDEPCPEHRVAFFFKQWGEWAPIEDDDAPYGEYHLGVELGDEPGWVDSCMCSAGHKPTLYRIGRKRAGDLLDGRQWQEFPAGVVR